MVGEKSSVVPIAIGGIIIAAVAVAVWYATRGSQTQEATEGNVSVPTVRVTPRGGSGAARDNAVGDEATSDNAMSGNEAGNSAGNTMGGENTTGGAMGAENSVGGNPAGTDNAMSGAGNTSPMGSAGANSASGMNGAGNAASPMTRATPRGGNRPMTGGNAMPVPPPVTNR